LLTEAAGAVDGQRFSLHFLATEWEDVVDAWQLETWEAYRDVARLGRKTRLPEKQRQILWPVFERVRSGLRVTPQLAVTTIQTEGPPRIGGRRYGAAARRWRIVPARKDRPVG
jgi:hypothetical protein